MWYLVHQQAKDIIAAHEREAAERRLASAAAGYGAGAPRSDRPGPARRVFARLAAEASGSLARMATALDPCSLEAPGGRG